MSDHHNVGGNDCANDGSHSINHGTVAAGSGLLTTTSGTVTTTATITGTVTLGAGNFTLLDNQTNQSVTAGNGNANIIELGTGVATFTLLNGNDSITDMAGGAIVNIGTGDSHINLGGLANTITVGPTLGGVHDETSINTGTGNAVVHAGNGNMDINAGGVGNSITVGNGNDEISTGTGTATVTTGNGNMDINAGGANNTITVGTGTNQIQLGQENEGAEHGATPTTAPLTSDTLYLSAGLSTSSNHVFLGGSGNTIYDSAGNDTISGAGTGNNTFVLNALGGTQSISGFSMTNGDVINLTKFFGATPPILPDLSLSVKSMTDATHSTWTDTILTATNGSVTDTVTLLNTGSALTALASGPSSSVIL